MKFSCYLETNKEFLTSNIYDDVVEEYCGININYLKLYMSKELNAHDFQISFNKYDSFPLRIKMKFSSNGVVDGTIAFDIEKKQMGGDYPRKFIISFIFLGIHNKFQPLYISTFENYDTNKPKDNNHIVRAAVEDIKNGLPSAIDKSIESATILGNARSSTGQEGVPLETQEEIIKSNPKYIRYIDHPDKSIQDKIIAQDRMNFLLIKNPDPELEEKYKYLRIIKKAGIIKWKHL